MFQTIVFADDNKFQQYNQKIEKPPIQYNYVPTPLGFWYGAYMNDRYYYQQQINDRNYYLSGYDKETYTSGDEFKIKKD